MGSASIGYQIGISARFYGNFNLSSDVTVSSLPCKVDVSIKSLFSAPSSTHKVKEPSLVISLNLVYANNTKVPNFQSGSQEFYQLLLLFCFGFRSSLVGGYS